MTDKPTSVRDGGRKTIAFIAIGQICLLGVTPLLTRRYSVTDIAIYQLGFALAIVCQPWSTLRLELVVPVRAMAVARHLYRVSALTNVALSAALAVVGVALARVDQRHSHLAWILISSALVLLVIGNVTADNSWLIRQGQLDKLAWRNLATGAFGGVFQVCTTATWVSPISLAVAYAAGRVVAIAVTAPMGRPVLPEGDNRDDAHPYTWRRAVASITALSLSSVSLQAPVIVTAIVLGTAASGQLSLAQRIAGVPGSLLSLGVAQYVTHRASVLIRSGDAPLAPFVGRMARSLVMVGLLTAPVLAIAGPTLVPAVFGADWRVAGYALAIFAVPFGLQISVFPMLAVYGLVERDTRILVMQAIRAAALIIATLTAAWLSHSVLVTAAAAAAVITLSYAAIIRGALGVAREFDSTRRPLPPPITVTAATTPAPSIRKAVPPRTIGRPPATPAASIDAGVARLPRRASSAGVLSTYLVTAGILLATLVGLLNRQLLPMRYFNDDVRIQRFVAYPYLVTRDGSYRRTADLYRALHLGGHPLLVAALALMMYFAVLIRVLYLTSDSERGPAYWLIVAGSIAFGGIYLPMYSKEFFLLPIASAFVMFTSRRGRFIWIGLALGYAVLVRTYWFGVVALFVANMYAVRQLRTTRGRLGYLALVFVGLVLVLSTGFGNTVGYQRESTLASLSFDPTTAIHTPFGGGFVANVANVGYVAVTLMVPIPLMTKGLVYLLTAVFITICWASLLLTARRRNGLRAAASSLARESGCLLLAYVVTLALFEPDYGSYLRHLTPLLPLFLLTRPRRSQPTAGASVSEASNAQRPEVTARA